MKRAIENSPDKQAKRAKTLLITVWDAIKIDNVDNLKTLYENGVSLNDLNEEGYHALHFAAINNALKCLSYLIIDKKINIGLALSDRSIALHLAALRGHTAAKCNAMLLSLSASPILIFLSIIK